MLSGLQLQAEKNVSDMNLNEYSPMMSLKTNDWSEEAECYWDSFSDLLRVVGRISRVGFNLELNEGDKIKLATVLLGNVKQSTLLDFAPEELVKIARDIESHHSIEDNFERPEEGN